MLRLLAIVPLLALGVGCHASPGGPSEPADAAAAPAPVASASAARDPRPALGAVRREGSVIARAPTNDALYVADEDHGVLRTLALPVDRKAPRLTETALPGRPAQVLATATRVLVSIRQADPGSGALVVFRRKGGALEQEAVIPLPGDAWGLALTPDERLVLVSTAWTHRVAAIELGEGAPRLRWSVDVAREPRGIVILPAGDRAYVTHLVGSAVTRLDGLGGSAPTVTRVELPAAPLRSPVGVKLPAALGYAAVADPRGDRVYFPRQALGALGPEAWAGTSAVDVLLTRSDTPLAPPRLGAPPHSFQADYGKDFESVSYIDGASPAGHDPAFFPEPRDVVYRAKTGTLLIASEGANALVELDATSMDPALIKRHDYKLGRKVDKFLGVAESGGAPSGLVLSANEDEAYVFCRTTYDLAVLSLIPGDGAWNVEPPWLVPLAADPASKEVSIGRRLFHDATLSILTGSSSSVTHGVACAGCHPEGRDDGHVWHEVTIDFGTTSDHAKFAIFLAGPELSIFKARWPNLEIAAEGGYARQTPMLAGRVKAQGPYGWHAESPDLPARLIAGFHLHRWGGVENDPNNERAMAGYLLSFLREGLVLPPSEPRPLSEEEQRGKAIFEGRAAACSTCHVPQSGYTDRVAVALPRLPAPPGFAKDPNEAYKTPSLLYVGSTPPYLHDGRYDTLEALIDANANRMGKTAQLSPEEKSALVAFLKTL